MFRSKFIKFLLSILDWQVISSSNFASFFVIMTHNSPVNLKLIHFLLWIKGSHQSANFETLKWSGENFPNFSCHFPNHKSVFLQILHDALVSWKITLLAQTFYTLVKSIPLKYKFFETFECSGQNSSNYLCHFWNDKSTPLQSFHHSSASLYTTLL